MDQARSEEVLEALRRIDSQVAQAAANAERMQSVAERISGITAVVGSPRNEVTVTVDVNGRLTDVRFTAAAMELTPQALGTLLLDAVAEGYRQASAESVELAAEALGPASTTVAQLRDGIQGYAPRIERHDDGFLR